MHVCVSVHACEQRDRPIIKDMLHHIEQYSSRNQRTRTEKVETERRRLHEAQHAQLGGPASEEHGALTAGDKEEEEEKEVDPSIVGSLDNVYKDEPGADMKEEDPFKKVPVLSDHEKPMMEMEKSYDAMVALVEDSPDSPLPEDATSLDRELRHPPSVNEDSASIPNFLPDLVGVVHYSGTSPSTPPPTSSSNTHTATRGLPLDLAVGAQRSVDLLEEAGQATGGLSVSQPVDLTKGLQPTPTFTS